MVGIVFSCCLGIPLHIIQVSGTIIGLKRKGSTHFSGWFGLAKAEFKWVYV